MQNKCEHLTAQECDELVEALRQEAANLSSGTKRDRLLDLAEGYRLLADLKRVLLRKAT